MEINMNQYEHKHQDITVTEEEENLIVFNLRNGTVSRLNSIGKMIWTNIPDKNIDEIIDLIVEKYDAEREQVNKDVKKFVDGLINADLIVAKH